MKLRLGFVPNSSSESFICDLCRDEEELYGLFDSDKCRCVNGHIFCMTHVKPEYRRNLYHSYTEKEFRKKLKEFFHPSATERLDERLKEGTESFEDIRDDLISHFQLTSQDEMLLEHCPICRLDLIRGEDLFQYMKALGFELLVDIKFKIRETFKDHKAFSKYLEKSNAEKFI